MMKNQKLRALTVLLFISLLCCVAGAQTGGPYDLSWNTFDGGGARSSGGVYSLWATSGQLDARPAMTGGAYALTGGFWPGVIYTQEKPEKINSWFFY